MVTNNRILILKNAYKVAFTLMPIAFPSAPIAVVWLTFNFIATYGANKNPNFVGCYLHPVECSFLFLT
jgi:hypothetical protein